MTGWSKIVRILFALPFVAVGAFVIGVSIKHREIFEGIFGLVFFGFGTRQIAQSFLRRTPTVEPAVAVARAPHGDYRTAEAADDSAREVYKSILTVAPLPRLHTTAGTTLSVALVGAKPEWAMLVLGIVWTALSLFMLVPVAMNGIVVGIAFMSLFVLIGFLMLFFSIRKLLSRLKLPRVEIAAEPVYLGDEVSVRVEQRGPANITRLRVELVCRETATYTVGTTTRSETHDAVHFELLDTPGRGLSRGETWPNDIQMTLPATAPHSFKSKNNAIAWSIRVRAEIAGWPDYDELFELRALPRVLA